jgi:hypothetical protein
MIARLWRDHSLTIILWAIGLTLTALAFFWEPGSWGWDLFMTFGGGCSTVALFYSLAGCFRERNKPEE